MADEEKVEIKSETKQEPGNIKAHLIISATSLTQKMTGGRYLLTIAAALCLILFSSVDCYVAVKNMDVAKEERTVMPVDPAVVMTLIGVVFTAYFNKREAEDQANANKNK